MDRGHSVDVLIPYHPDLRLPEKDKIGIKVFRYVLPSSLAIMGYSEAMASDTALRPISYALAPLFAMHEARALLSLHARNHYDVIHGHWVIPNGAVAAFVARLIRRPLVISLHGSDIFFAGRDPLLRKIAAWTMRQAVAVTACSREIAARARHVGASADKVHLLPWGADPTFFSLDRTAARTALHLDQETPIILSLGRLVKKKGLNVLMQALPAVFAQVPGARCVVAGSGPELGPLQKQAAALGIGERVDFVGGVPWDQTASWFAACDVFVAPSIHDENGNVDGLPTTVLEAMAAARPVVASHVAGMELVVENGRTGILTPEYDAAALARALQLVLTEPGLKLSMGEAARRAVVDTFNWDTVAARFEQLYQA